MSLEIEIKLTGEIHRRFNEQTGELIYLVLVEPIILNEEEWNKIKKEETIQLVEKSVDSPTKIKGSGSSQDYTASSQD